MIKIIVNNIDLPLVFNSLKIAKENNSFNSSFNINKTTRPFVVIENELTQQALGARNLYTNKPLIIENVVVIDGYETYNATLTVREYVAGGRKCDVAYYNALLPHLSNKIHTYFNEVSVNNSTPTPYQKESTTNFSDNAYIGFVENVISRNFDEVDFNFPTLPYPNLFGENLQPDADWYLYKGFINDKTLGQVSLNSNSGTLINQNLVVPYYYLLAPLYKVFATTLQYTINGSFVANTANFKRLMYHKNNNLVQVLENNKKVYKNHLTIHPERFLEPWTVAEYLNHLKNCFNLEIKINHLTKSISLNYTEDVYFTNAKVYNASYLAVSKDNLPTFTDVSNYLIKDASGTDVVNVTTSTVTNLATSTPTTVSIDTKFKNVPEVLTKTWEDLSGVGLLFYNYTTNDTFAVQSFNNETNVMSGNNGIVAKYWLKWLRFRLQEKTIKPVLILSQKQKNDLEKAVKIYLFNQYYLLKKIEVEMVDERYKTTLELLSIV